MDRRHLLGLGGMAALLAPGAAEAAAPAVSLPTGPSSISASRRTLPHDQSGAMQKAIDELAASRQPIVIPAGNYRAQKLVLPSNATVLGVPGLSVLTAPGKAPIFESAGPDVSLRGVTFAGFGLLALECRNLSDLRLPSSLKPRRRHRMRGHRPVHRRQQGRLLRQGRDLGERRRHGDEQSRERPRPVWLAHRRGLPGSAR